MQITINNYRIRRYDSLNLCVEVKKEKQKAKNPYGRNGKKGNDLIEQNNSSNNIEYKWHLIGYYSTLDYSLKKLVEDCLSNDEEINTIQDIINKITQLHEKINKISADNERFIEQNILSSCADQEDQVEQLAKKAINQA
jgi:hypothetical protein